MFAIEGANTADEVGRTSTFIVPSGNITVYCNRAFLHATYRLGIREDTENGSRIVGDSERDRQSRRKDF
jgi:hypothetical protein